MGMCYDGHELVGDDSDWVKGKRCFAGGSRTHREVVLKGRIISRLD